MAITSGRPASRRLTIASFASLGLVGLATLILMSVLRFDEAVRIHHDLGDRGTALVLIFAAFCLTLALLRFELTDLVFVNLVMIAIIAMFPLLGMVWSGWIATLSTIVPRVIRLLPLDVERQSLDDPPLEWTKMFGLFGIYGIPVIIATLVYELLGGVSPVTVISTAEVGRVVISGLILIIVNNLIMFLVMGLYGYAPRVRLQLVSVDSSIYLMILPYSVVVALSYTAMGPGAVLALAFTGVVMNMIARSLSLARASSERQVRRLASLTTIGKSISLRFTRDEFLHTIYEETRKVVDAPIFSISLYDETREELRFELDVIDEEIQPNSSMPLGPGLNSWIVRNQKPLLLSSLRQERSLGLRSIEDGLATESWMGVPMMALDRVIGVISVQSYRKNAFSEDDLVLLTAIANQAAVALESSQLYGDLEGLTYALEQRVAERTYELQDANLRLMAADRSKNQFLANMSHELRTPLNSIIGFSSVLLKNAKSSLDTRLYRFLENIHTAGTHLLVLINDILDLSKIEAGRMELRLERFDIRETIASVQRVMKGFVEDASIEIIDTVDDDVPKVLLDEGRLKQILFNLLSNAVKFSPGGGTIRLEVRHLRAASSPLAADTIRIIVADQGLGIAPEELERIFDQFYQTRPAQRAARRGGTGLGLSLTKNFVELHHGRIDVRSRLGEGTTFTIDLPADAEAASRRSQPAEPGQSARGATLRR